MKKNYRDSNNKKNRLNRNCKAREKIDKNKSLAKSRLLII